MKSYTKWAQKQILFVFWGLILNHFHLNINQIDLLPDFVGFILFYLAIDGLAQNMPEYDRLKALAAVFAVVEGGGFLVRLLGMQLPVSGWTMLGSVIMGLAFAYFDYQLFSVVIDTAHIHRCESRMESLCTVRMVRLVCNLFAAATELLANRMPIVVGVLAVVGIVAAIWSCVEVYGFWKELGEQSTEQ